MEVKIVLSNTGERIEMDETIFKGDFNNKFSSAVLRKLNEYAISFKAGQSFEPKVTKILSDVICTGFELSWNDEFMITLANNL